MSEVEFVEITIVSELGSDERIYVEGVLYVSQDKPLRSPMTTYDESDGAVQMIDLIEAVDGRLARIEYVELNFYQISWPNELLQAVTDPGEEQYEKT